MINESFVERNEEEELSYLLSFCASERSNLSEDFVNFEPYPEESVKPEPEPVVDKLRLAFDSYIKAFSIPEPCAHLYCGVRCNGGATYPLPEVYKS